MGMMIMASINTETKGIYWGYATMVEIISETHDLKIYDNGNVQFELNSSDKSTPSRSKVTLYNIDVDKINQIQKNDRVIVYTGPSDLYGVGGEGKIIKIESNYDGGKDKTTTITFTGSSDVTDATLHATFNGDSTVKVTESSTKKTKTKKSKLGTSTKKSKPKIQMSFKGKQSAKTIIKKIADNAGLSIGRINLATNKVYKRGYVVSGRPYQTIVKIVNDCKSEIYQRNGQIIIDDYSVENPFHEHIYFGLGSGLLSEPSTYDKQTTGKDKNKAKQCYILECFLDPRVQAGSSVFVDSQQLKGLHRVQSCKLTHQSDYTMEVVIYA